MNAPGYMLEQVTRKEVRNVLKYNGVAKFDPKVGSQRTTKIENLVVLVIILVALIL